MGHLTAFKTDLLHSSALFALLVSTPIVAQAADFQPDALLKRAHSDEYKVTISTKVMQATIRR